MSAATVSSTFILNAVPRTHCDNEVYITWYPVSRSSTVVLGDCPNAESERGSTIFIAKYIVVVRAIL